MPDVDIITGGSRVRHWTEKKRCRFCRRLLSPVAITVRVAKRMNVSTGQLYTWRKQLMNPPSPRSGAMKKEAACENGFAQVVVASDHASFASSPIANGLPGCDFAIGVSGLGNYGAGAGFRPAVLVASDAGASGN